VARGKRGGFGQSKNIATQEPQIKNKKGRKGEIVVCEVGPGEKKRSSCKGREVLIEGEKREDAFSGKRGKGGLRERKRKRKPGVSVSPRVESGGKQRGWVSKRTRRRRGERIKGKKEKQQANGSKNWKDNTQQLEMQLLGSYGETPRDSNFIRR